MTLIILVRICHLFVYELYCKLIIKHSKSRCRCSGYWYLIVPIYLSFEWLKVMWGITLSILWTEKRPQLYGLQRYFQTTNETGCIFLCCLITEKCKLHSELWKVLDWKPKTYCFTKKGGTKKFCFERLKKASKAPQLTTKAKSNGVLLVNFNLAYLWNSSVSRHELCQKLDFARNDKGALAQKVLDLLQTVNPLFIGEAAMPPFRPQNLERVLKIPNLLSANGKLRQSNPRLLEPDVVGPQQLVIYRGQESILITCHKETLFFTMT